MAPFHRSRASRACHLLFRAKRERPFARFDLSGKRSCSLSCFSLALTTGYLTGSTSDPLVRVTYSLLKTVVSSYLQDRKANFCLLPTAYCLLLSASCFMLSSDSHAGVAEWQTLRT